MCVHIRIRIRSIYIYICAHVHLLCIYIHIHMYVLGLCTHISSPRTWESISIGNHMIVTCLGSGSGF